MSDVKASICIATYNKPKYLKRVLDSIIIQSPSFDYEIIVVDDGSPEKSTAYICSLYDKVRYYRIERASVYRNPSAARNLAYSKAKGEVLILQSDDVFHEMEVITNLVRLLEPGRFVISTVFNIDYDTKGPVYYLGKWHQFTGPIIDKGHSPNPRRPLFFLGSVYREDVYAINGCDEDFVDPGRDDVWFADCLMNELALEPYYTSEVVGYHLHHDRPSNLNSRARRSMMVYMKKRMEAQKTGIWRAGKGLDLYILDNATPSSSSM